MVEAGGLVAEDEGAVLAFGKELLFHEFAYELELIEVVIIRLLEHLLVFAQLFELVGVLLRSRGADRDDITKRIAVVEVLGSLEACLVLCHYEAIELFHVWPKIILVPLQKALQLLGPLLRPHARLLKFFRKLALEVID